ncbi:MAG: DUF2635 domain-containing protein [Sneathiella sp.]
MNSEEKMALHLKPNPDKKVDGKPIKVFDPVRKDYLPTEGRNVPNTPYMRRRLRDKDVAQSAVVYSPAGGSADDEKPVMTLEEAVAYCYEQNDDEHLTNAGIPDAKVLSKLTGSQISAAMRNAALPEKDAE